MGAKCCGLQKDEVQHEKLIESRTNSPAKVAPASDHSPAVRAQKKKTSKSGRQEKSSPRESDAKAEQRASGKSSHRNRTIGSIDSSRGGNDSVVRAVHTTLEAIDTLDSATTPTPVETSTHHKDMIEHDDSQGKDTSHLQRAPSPPIEYTMPLPDSTFDENASSNWGIQNTTCATKDMCNDSLRSGWASENSKIAAKAFGDHGQRHVPSATSAECSIASRQTERARPKKHASNKSNGSSHTSRKHVPLDASNQQTEQHDTTVRSQAQRKRNKRKKAA